MPLFYNDTYSEYYKTLFLNKNEKNVLEKYIFSFYTNRIATNRIRAGYANLNGTFSFPFN